MKILIIQGHPDSQSFTRANALNYYRKAEQAGHNVKIIDLSISEEFNPVLQYGYRKHMADETYPNKWQGLIKWADHLSFFFPIWWSAEPAILKGFLDRTLTPGFAYAYDRKTEKKLLFLAPRTADIFISSNGPAFFYTKIYGNVISRWKHLVLGFVGIKLKHGLDLGNMNKRKITEQDRKNYIKKCANTIPILK